MAVAFKTGLFNIGAPGQYLMGTMVTLMLALGIPSEVVPAWLIWIIAFVGGCLAGAVWGAIPGLLKAFLNINEVLACIMTNWIGSQPGYLDVRHVSNFKNVVENTKSGYIYKTTFNGVATPKMGLDHLFPNSQVNMGIVIAILIAILDVHHHEQNHPGLPAQGLRCQPPRCPVCRDSGQDGILCCPWPLPARWPAAGASLYYLSGNTEFYLVHLSVPAQQRASTAFPWRCWR